mgnify:FL=1
MGTLYFKSSAKRVVARRHALLDQGNEKLLEDLAGVTVVRRTVPTEQGPMELEEEISPADRRRAYETLRDTLDGRPQPEPATQQGPTNVVYVVNAVPGADPAWPRELQRLLDKELELGVPEPVDLDDAHALPEHQENGVTEE